MPNTLKSSSHGKFNLQDNFFLGWGLQRRLAEAAAWECSCHRSGLRIVVVLGGHSPSIHSGLCGMCQRLFNIVSVLLTLLEIHDL